MIEFMETAYIWIEAAAQRSAEYLWGGWSLQLNLLLWMIIVSGLMGCGAEWMERNLKSRTMYILLARKATVFVMIAISHLMDKTWGEMSYFQNTVVFFYLANELLTIIDHAGRIGVPVPHALKNAVKLFHSKSRDE
ncbi:phage holin family protein [Paenibacillus lemnae]|uniref:Holin n=1 Tax=Paenibacillus lemnae TaxID=1330551 RepID=A0A848M757_PAELE|nr:phage holin family protein [Paenibacillus lemnae]NMO95683.1 holin [Paenibacillus lemnae]